MEQKDKELLLRDLCARLPYGTKGLCTEISTHEVYAIEGVCVYYRDVPIVHLRDQGLINMPIMYVRPYLFPLSSMTEEQEDEWRDICLQPLIKRLDRHTRKKDLMLYAESQYAGSDWLNKNHFDYRGLIGKGLAIDATGLNIY